MNRAAGLALFLAIALSILFGLHLFLWARLVRDPGWPRPWGAVLTAALALGAISIPVGLFFGRASAPGSHPWLTWPGSVWLGLMFLLFVSLLGFDLVRVGGRVISVVAQSAPADLERRRFFARVIAGAAALLASGFGVAALRSALGPVRVRRIEVHLPKLGADLDGLTVVQLSDLHVGPTIGRQQMEDIVRRTNALAPDVVAITGDLVDGTVAELWGAVAPLGGLVARLGVFFVTGNHEYYSGAAEWVEALPGLGVRVLRNERVELSRGASSLELGGVDDRSAARSGTPGHGEDLEKALAGWDRRRPLVLLAHQPRTVFDAARMGVDLQLSGHTHGGQIWPFGALVQLQQRFLAGLGRHRDTLIYVSRGTGYWGPPMRLGAPSEITELVLRAGALPGRTSGV
jgi:predicted MPP superfamily phosphohydrolase